MRKSTAEFRHNSQTVRKSRSGKNLGWAVISLMKPFSRASWTRVPLRMNHAIETNLLCHEL